MHRIAEQRPVDLYLLRFLFPDPRHAGRRVSSRACTRLKAKEGNPERIKESATPWLASSGVFAASSRADHSRATGTRCPMRTRNKAQSRLPTRSDGGFTALPAGSPSSSSPPRSLGQLLHQQPARGLHRHRRRARWPAGAVHAERVYPHARPQGATACLRTPSARHRTGAGLRGRRCSHRLKLDHGTCIPPLAHPASISACRWCP